MRGNEEKKEGSIVAEVERWEERAVGAADFVFVDVLFVKMLLVKSRNRATIDTRTNDTESLSKEIVYM